MGLILKPHEAAGVLVGPDGKTPLARAGTDRRARRRARSKLCDRCGENPKERKLPNGIRVCMKCYLDDNPLGAERLTRFMKAKAQNAKLQEAKRDRAAD